VFDARLMRLNKSFIHSVKSHYVGLSTHYRPKLIS